MGGQLHLQRKEEYLGFGITVEGFKPSDFPGLVARVEIIDEREQPVCAFLEYLDRLIQRRGEWPDDKDQAAEQLMDRAFHRARGAILLDKLDELNEGKFYVQQSETYARRGRAYISHLVLQALENVIHIAPGDGREHLDDVGICLLENFDPHEFEYALTRLQRSGLIEPWSIGGKPGSRVFRATALGLAEADKLSSEKHAPGFLLEETIADFERTLGRHNHLLVDKLRGLTVRVAESRELDQHDVGEIAQACELVIQDFLDLDVLWDGIPGDRPAKGRTRDRLRTLLKARAPSETEQEMLDALEEYVVGWFGRLEKFVHKYRHPPDDSERRHAKRCVLYTYLLLADLTELLGL